MITTCESDRVPPATVEQAKQLLFNERTFVQLGAVPPSDFCGFFKASSAGVHLYRPSGEVEAYLVANPTQGYFAVTAFRRDKSVWYMQACTAETESWLGLQDLSMSVERDLILSAVRQVR